MDISLALGGGGMKGHAHIGVLRALERAGFRIRAIAGTSAGGVWGSFYAAGYSPDEMERRASLLKISSLYTRKPGDGPAMLGLAGVCDLFDENLGELTFEDLRLPFAVTAVDMETAELMMLQTGRVVDAVIATISIPGFFPYKEWGGRKLIDGGILDPVPVQLARFLAPDLPVLAVVLSPKMEAWKRPVKPRVLNSVPFVGNYLSRSRYAQAVSQFMQSIDMGGAMLTELRLQVDQPEVIIRPDVPQVGLLDDVNVSDLARIGEEAVIAALPELREAVSWRSRFSRHFVTRGQNGYVWRRRNGKATPQRSDEHQLKRMNTSGS